MSHERTELRQFTIVDLSKKKTPSVSSVVDKLVKKLFKLTKNLNKQ